MAAERMLLAMETNMAVGICQNNWFLAKCKVPNSMPGKANFRSGNTNQANMNRLKPNSMLGKANIWSGIPNRANMNRSEANMANIVLQGANGLCGKAMVANVSLSNPNIAVNRDCFANIMKLQLKRGKSISAHSKAHNMRKASPMKPNNATYVSVARPY